MNFVKLPSGKRINLSNVTMIVRSSNIYPDGAEVYFNATETSMAGEGVSMASTDIDDTDTASLLRYVDLACQNLTLAEATGDSQDTAQGTALRANMPKLTEAREQLDKALMWIDMPKSMRGRITTVANLIDQFMAAIPNREARNG